MPAPVDVVVARYREDLSWLKRLPTDFRPVVYDKGGDSPIAAESLPNRGREAQTYLHHIVTRYEHLPEWTVFCQGFPFDHEPSFRKHLQTFLHAKGELPEFIWTGLFVDFDYGDGSRVFTTWSGNPDGHPLAMDEFWLELFGTHPPGRYEFMPGAQFIVHRHRILSRPRTFYEKAAILAESFPDAAHGFERCWDRVFDTSGIPDEVRTGPLPIYLRPIKRLGITWETCATLPGHLFYDA